MQTHWSGGYGERVVSILSAKRPVSFPALAEVEAYWEALAAGRAMPDRTEIDPRGIEGALAHAFVLDRVAPGIARFRVAGHHLSDLMGMECRGMPLSAMALPEARQGFADLLEELVSRPATATLSLTSDRGIGRPALTARMYLAPLSAGGDAGARYLGALQCHGTIGRTPRRFGIAHLLVRPIDRPMPDLSPAPRHQHPERLYELAENAAPFRGPTAPELRLVKSD